MIFFATHPIQQEKICPLSILRRSIFLLDIGCVLKFIEISAHYFKEILNLIDFLVIFQNVLFKENFTENPWFTFYTLWIFRILHKKTFWCATLIF